MKNIFFVLITFLGTPFHHEKLLANSGDVFFDRNNFEKTSDDELIERIFRVPNIKSPYWFYEDGKIYLNPFWEDHVEELDGDQVVIYDRTGKGKIYDLGQIEHDLCIHADKKGLFVYSADCYELDSIELFLLMRSAVLKHKNDPRLISIKNSLRGDDNAYHSIHHYLNDGKRFSNFVPGSHKYMGTKDKVNVYTYNPFDDYHTTYLDFASDENLSQKNLCKIILDVFGLYEADSEEEIECKKLPPAFKDQFEEKGTYEIFCEGTKIQFLSSSYTLRANKTIYYVLCFSKFSPPHWRKSRTCFFSLDDFDDSDDFDDFDDE